MAILSTGTKEAIKAPVSDHPNASLATVAGSLATLVLWGAGAIGIALSAEAGAGLATVLVATSLFVGRRGIRGLLGAIWKGTGDE
jgi:hypothetical protein